jgi:glycosyltransferase involved in cell wall biosynthesis
LERHGSKPKLIILVNNDFFFLSHRLALARAARDAGFVTAVATRVHADGDAIRAEGFELFPLRHFIGDNLNPLRELLAVRELARLYRRQRPDIVHHVGLKMSLTGTLAARAAGVPCLLNTFTGLGFLFTSATGKDAWVREIALRALKRSLRGRHFRLSFQNREDRDEFLARKVAEPADTVLIRGSGVDISQFPARAQPGGTPLVLFASRMLRDKGLLELVAAARMLRARGQCFRVALAGLPDPGNPRTVSEPELLGWQEEGIVEWWGQRKDMPAVMAEAHIVCLPSYREGLPRILLEAAASTRPIVATDIAGCREVVKDGVNGLLVPPRDATALANALQRLIEDGALRERMGRAGRDLVERELCDEPINRQTLGVYRELLDEAGRNQATDATRNSSQ